MISWLATLTITGSLAFAISASGFEITESYVRTNVAGFEILLSAALQSRTGLQDKALEEIASQAEQIRGAVSPAVWERLRKVPIWLEWQAKTNGAAEYHPSRAWLSGNGYNPEKAKAIEINNARNFVEWSRRDQPSMLLHELAHAFHDQVLGWDDPDVKAAFRQAVASGRYDKVRHVRGSETRAYALTDEKEYFAELSEAFLGRNDFYPFDRADLKGFDPAGLALLRTKWQALASPHTAVDPPGKCDSVEITRPKNWNHFSSTPVPPITSETPELSP